MEFAGISCVQPGCRSLVVELEEATQRVRPGRIAREAAYSDDCAPIARVIVSVVEQLLDDDDQAVVKATMLQVVEVGHQPQRPQR